MNRFYVYEHWRPDTDLCFWVGKGTADRAYRFKRNPTYNAIIAELAIQGLCAEVRIVYGGLSEYNALRIECERIAFWKQAGITLTNRVDGGRGNRGLFVSEETREKLRIANLGKKQSAETRAKRSASLKKAFLSGRKIGGRPAGFVHSEETKARMGLVQKGRSCSPETIEKLRLANLGKKHSIETRMLMSAQRLGNK